MPEVAHLGNERGGDELNAPLYAAARRVVGVDGLDVVKTIPWSVSSNKLCELRLAESSPKLASPKQRVKLAAGNWNSAWRE